MEVSAPGFKTWNPGHPLHLQPGSEMDLNILMEPTHDPSLHPSRFLVPAGYVGWLQLEYGLKDAPSLLAEDGVKVFKFPAGGMLKVSGAVPLSIAMWHLHTNLCIPPKADALSMDRAKFGLQGSIATQDACDAAGGRFHPVIFGWMVHVHPYEDSLDKIFAMHMHMD